MFAPIQGFGQLGIQDTLDTMSLSKYHLGQKMASTGLKDNKDYEVVSSSLLFSPSEAYRFQGSPIVSFSRGTLRGSKKLSAYSSLNLSDSDTIFRKQKLMSRKNIAETLNKTLHRVGKSGFFEQLFGSTKIEFDINGSIGAGLEGIYQRIENPSFTHSNRNNLDFVLNQYALLSLSGNIGEHVKLVGNYDSQATFRFQNDVKIKFKAVDGSFQDTINIFKNPAYSPFVTTQTTASKKLFPSLEENLFSGNPYQDNIIQNFEIGNVSMPLQSNLISGIQDLFGVRADFKLGNTSITTVISRQRSSLSNITAQGNTSTQTVELSPLDYQENQHYFLAHYFRDNYEDALANYPFIQTEVQITRIEVWVTNVNFQAQNIRSVVALQNLGEASPDKIYFENQLPPDFFNHHSSAPPSNFNNILNPDINRGNSVLTSQIRELSTVNQGFGDLAPSVKGGFDYEIIENAVLLSPQQYTYHPNLGYISLNVPLEEDEVLAVAFEYNFRGEIYQVGEFSEQIDLSQAGSDNLLIVKMLKSSLLKSDQPIWDLMMKNIYHTGIFGLAQGDLQVNLFYGKPVPANNLQPVETRNWPEGLEQQNLLHVFKLDQLNSYMDKVDRGDGLFDFVPGLTVDPEKGHIIFPLVEPFGRYLFELLNDPESVRDYSKLEDYNANQEKYVYQELYKTAKDVALEVEEKNNFTIKINAKTQFGGISIGAVNVPRGSVRVSVSGRTLQEGIDYTVNYQLGLVNILDQSIVASGIPVDISLEDTTLFNQQAKNFFGIHAMQRISDQLHLDATFLNLSEKPFTQKANYGQDPVRNQMVGLGLQYQTYLPFIDFILRKSEDLEKTTSYLSVRADVAGLKVRDSRYTNQGGSSQIFIDDFDSSTIKTNLKNSSEWILSSVPEDQDFYGANRQGIANGFGRTKMAWYSIDPIFYTQNRPNEITLEEISSNTTRQITIEELFPNRDLVTGTNHLQSTFDLAYFPDQRGPYNNASDTEFQNSVKERWAGITRSIESTNFSNANIQYIEFWLLDTFSDSSASNEELGELVFHLGSVSEDILKDGKKLYENGLGDSRLLGQQNTLTSWGRVPIKRSLLYSFDGVDNRREFQDLGLDGIDNAEEALIYTNGDESDPAGDDYVFYLQATGDLLERYKHYNGTQNNAFTSISSSNRASTTLPDVEDINRDQTMNTLERYFEYRIPIKKDMSPANHPFVRDVSKGSLVISPNGKMIEPRWLLFRVPIIPAYYSKGSNRTYFQAHNGISDIRSIRFVRMLLQGFEALTVLRFATLDLVNADWRIYQKSLDGVNVISSNSRLEIGSVSIQENNQKVPINYALPPDTSREQFVFGNELNRQNEQSLVLRVENLGAKEKRGVFKSMDLDIRNHQRLRMHLHAESLPHKESLPGDDGKPYDVDKSLVAFIRFGSDQTENYYQIEIPLRPTDKSKGNTVRYTSEQVWMPEFNQLDISIPFLAELKLKVLSNLNSREPIFFDANQNIIDKNSSFSNLPGSKKYRYSIKGFPSLADIKSIVIGLKNPNEELGKSLSAEVWFNELRLVGIRDDGGSAVSGSAELKLGDFAHIFSSVKQSSFGFGALNRKAFQRDGNKVLEFNFSTTANLGQLLPEKWGLNIPFTYLNNGEITTPENDPLHSDILLEDRMDNLDGYSQADVLLDQFQQVTRTKLISIQGLRKQRNSDTHLKFYSPENLNFSMSYNAYRYRDHELAYQEQKNLYLNLDYSYSFEQKAIALFGKVSNTLDWQPDIQLNLLPSSIRFNSNIDRSINAQSYRSVLFLSGTLGDSILPELLDTNYRLNYQYGFTYPIFNSLVFDLSFSTSNILREDNQSAEMAIWDGLFNFGQPDQHYHSVSMDYVFPFEKIPALDFLSAKYRYFGEYSWKRGSSVLTDFSTINRSLTGSINTIQNNNSKTLSASIEFDRVRNLMGLDNISSREKSPLMLLLHILTSFDRFRVDYNEQNGTFLPGYLPSLGFVGVLRPGLKFSLGSQADIRFEAAKKGWLTDMPEFSQRYQKEHRSGFNFFVDYEPLSILSISLSATRAYSRTQVEDFIVDSDMYDATFSNHYGSFEISGVFLKSILSRMDVSPNSLYEKFQGIAPEVAMNLAISRGITEHKDLYPKGFSRLHPDVLLRSFLDVYGNYTFDKSNYSPIRNLPLPNWQLKLDLLGNSPRRGNTFNRLNISHGYSGSYTINNFTGNIRFNKDTPIQFDNRGQVVPSRLYSDLNIVERFNPLIRVDIEFSNSLVVDFAINRESAVSLSLPNQLLTESGGVEYSFGMGYQIIDRNLEYSSSSKYSTIGSLKANIDMSYRDNLVVVRNLQNDSYQVTAGQNYFSIRVSGEYIISSRISAELFYNHDIISHEVSFGFPTNSIRSGISFRYDFGG